MEEQLITLETSKLAKQKGFSEKCNYYYQDGGLVYQVNSNSDGYDEPSAPTQALLQQWLRVNHDIEINVMRMPPEAVKASFDNGNKILKKYNMWVWNLNGNPRIENGSLYFDVYEEALEFGLQEALKLIN